jgi:4-hydroxythreonine-4-phosphate dehydrogenase
LTGFRRTFSVSSVPPTLAVTLGDPTGIGPEVALRALGKVLGEDDTRYVVVGDRELIHRLGGIPGWTGELPPWSAARDAGDRIRLVSPGPALPAALAPGARPAAEAAVTWLRWAGEACQRGDCQGVVTGPVNKEAILNAGYPFVGQTEFLAELTGTRRYAMMLLGHDDRGRWLRVALATIHLPLRAVPDALSPERVRRAIELADEACQRLRLPRRRIGVCGLNPHAGEGGHLGREEQEWIESTVAAAGSAGYDVVGPLAADTLFHQALHGAYDAVVAMYHDQGLGPLKLVAFDTGVNWTLGLPWVRTSPDHGTAYDLVGTGRAGTGSMEAALRLARRVCG